MKKSSPNREKDRWEHALTRPLRGLPFEMIELMRADLFEYLDVLTTTPYSDRRSCAELASRIQKVANRLRKITLYRARALRAATKAGRVEWRFPSRAEAARMPPCGPFSLPTWKDVHRHWELAR